MTAATSTRAALDAVRLDCLAECRVLLGAGIAYTAVCDALAYRSGEVLHTAVRTGDASGAFVYVRRSGADVPESRSVVVTDAAVTLNASGKLPAVRDDQGTYWAAVDAPRATRATPVRAPVPVLTATAPVPVRQTIYEVRDASGAILATCQGDDAEVHALKCAAALGGTAHRVIVTGTARPDQRA